jgi:pimeloyl-ACP methyl ester carboxylesterase
MPTSAVNGTRLFWEITGDIGDPMVLVHGSWGDHGNWASVVPALSRRFRVLTYDRRRHSSSERPIGQGSVREDVADLAAVLEDLRHAPAHVVGTSFGASIVLRLAAERPDLFRSLIVHEPPLFGLLKDDPHDPEALEIDLTGLRRFAAPALLTMGDQSPPFFPPVVDTVAAVLPRARTRTYAGAGHVPHLSHPGEYVDVVTEFVESETDAPSSA